jgi:acyl-CoA synthetase (AMP-forming)/AMP-acid ligase II
METLAAVTATGRDRDGPVVEAPDRTAAYTYREFSTNAWKVGNLLRHYGVRPGASLGVVAGPKEPTPDDRPGRLGSTPEPLLAFLGGACLGAVVDFEPPQPVDARALVLPDAWLDRYDVGPGCSRLAYGGPPETPGVAHFEREFWSENPTQPPDPVEPDDPVLRVGDREYTHADLLAGAQALVDEYGLTAGDRVAIDAPVTVAGTVVAGVVAPLFVGATIRLRAGNPLSDDVVYVVSGVSGWERPRVDPAAVLAD